MKRGKMTEVKLRRMSHTYMPNTRLTAVPQERLQKPAGSTITCHPSPMRILKVYAFLAKKEPTLQFHLFLPLMLTHP